jgi:hypothetical protein
MQDPSHPNDLDRTTVWARKACDSGESARSGAAQWSWDVVAGKLSWTSFVSPLFGSDILGEPETIDALVSRVVEGERTAVRDAFLACADSQGGDLQHQLEILWPDGSTHFVVMSGRLFVLEGGIRQLAGVAWDMTPQILAEQHVRNAWLFLDSIVENNPNAIFVKRAFDFRSLQ